MTDKQEAPRQIKTIEKLPGCSGAEELGCKGLNQTWPEVGQDMAGQDVTLAGVREKGDSRMSQV